MKVLVVFEKKQCLNISVLLYNSFQFGKNWKELESFSASLIANLAPKTYVPENAKSGTYTIFLQIFHSLRGKSSFTLLHFFVSMLIEDMSKVPP